MLELIKKKKKTQGLVPLLQRKPLEFSESPVKKTSHFSAHNDLIFKDQKIKDKIRGIFHKSRENKDKVKVVAIKNINQLKLKNESDDDSQESEKEGYNEQFSN